jgi:hypothetical protein
MDSYILLFKINSELSNILGFNFLVKSIQPVSPKFINLQSILLGLWSFVIFKLFAADHMRLSTYSSGCHTQCSWTNVSTSQNKARFLSSPWRCNTKTFLREMAEIFIPLIWAKPTEIGPSLLLFSHLKFCVFVPSPHACYIYPIHFVFGILIFLNTWKI